MLSFRARKFTTFFRFRYIKGSYFMLNSIKIPIYGEKPEGGYYFQIYFSNIFLRNNLQVKK